MEYVSETSDVVQFIDRLDGKKHIVIIYDDPDFAKLLKFRFIKNGLQNGENCAYVTDEDSGKTVIDMLNYGIPLKFFQTNKIVIYSHHENGKTREEIEKNARKNIEIIKKSLVPPFRIVGRIIPNVMSVEGISVQMDIEKKTHKDYDNFGGIVLCSYDLSKIEKTRRKKWITDLHNSHHHVINILGKEGNVVLTPNNYTN